MFGSGGADKIAQQQRADEVSRQARITQGMGDIANVFGGFNDGFYKKRYDDYMGYAEPQIDQQAGDARNQLIYALSRTGNLDSSAASKESADLTQEANQQRINAANQAQNEENGLRSNVEQTRGNVVSELNATGNAQEAANASASAIQNLNQPAGFSPLGTLFAGFANGLQAIGSRAGNGYSGFFGGGGSTPLFNAGSSARVVG